MSTPHPDPAVRAEMRRIRSSRPRYGYDSRRRARARQDAQDHRARVQRHLATIIVLLAVAVAIVGWDQEARHVQMTRPAEGHTTDVTSTLPPHPARTSSHP